MAEPALGADPKREDAQRASGRPSTPSRSRRQGARTAALNRKPATACTLRPLAVLALMLALFTVAPSAQGRVAFPDPDGTGSASQTPLSPPPSPPAPAAAPVASASDTPPAPAADPPAPPPAPPATSSPP